MEYIQYVHVRERGETETTDSAALSTFAESRSHLLPAGGRGNLN